MEKNMTGKICGTGSWAPDRVWDNNDLAKMVETVISGFGKEPVWYRDILQKRTKIL